MVALGALHLTKAIFILGGEAGVRLAEKMGAQAVVVDANGQVVKSAGILLEGP